MKWSQDEIDILKTFYQEKGPKELSKILNRNLKTISKKAKRLGLERGIAAGASLRKNIWSFKEWSYDLGYIAGVYLGDGNVWMGKNKSGYFRLSVIDQDFALSVKNKIENLTGFSASLRIINRKNKKQYLITFCNNDFVKFLIKEFGLANNKKFKVLSTDQANLGLLEGIFDSEGTIHYKNYLVRMNMDISCIESIPFIKNLKRNKNYKGITYNNKISKTGIPQYRFFLTQKHCKQIELGSYIERKASKLDITYKSTPRK